ncbi:MAG: HDOD domain-containing protein, partial [Acidobacteriota bacterium]|nr:HDOD domain-containing protein [Acidobacteriota bacterium]
ARLLADDRLERMASRLGSLPAMPSIYEKLIAALRSPDASLKEIGDIIATDAAMTSHILRLVNSAHLGLMREISNVGMAVNYLGVMTVSSLALGLHVFDACDAETLARLKLAQLWNKSFTTGAFARVIAQHQGLPTNETDDAFTAGLLHGCGRLVLASNLEEDYLEVIDLAAAEKVQVSRVESRELGFSHCEAGALMLARWGLSSAIIEAVAYHLEPAETPHGAFIPLTAVHVASALATQPPHRWVETPAGIDLEYLGRLGLEESLAEWIDACREVVDLERVSG